MLCVCLAADVCVPVALLCMFHSMLSCIQYTCKRQSTATTAPTKYTETNNLLFFCITSIVLRIFIVDASLMVLDSLQPRIVLQIVFQAHFTSRKYTPQHSPITISKRSNQLLAWLALALLCHCVCVILDGNSIQNVHSLTSAMSHVKIQLQNVFINVSSAQQNRCKYDALCSVFNQHRLGVNSCPHTLCVRSLLCDVSHITHFIYEVVQLFSSLLFRFTSVKRMMMWVGMGQTT